MALTKDVKETARLTIICNNKEQCTVKTKGDLNEMTAALACLMNTDHEDNKFREMMAVAIQLIITENEMEEKKAVKKKKAVVKKAATKKATSKKK